MVLFYFYNSDLCRNQQRPLRTKFALRKHMGFPVARPRRLPVVLCSHRHCYPPAYNAATIAIAVFAADIFRKLTILSVRYP